MRKLLSEYWEGPRRATVSVDTDTGVFWVEGSHGGEPWFQEGYRTEQSADSAAEDWVLQPE